MDYGRLAGLYRQYLGRDPEPGAESWLQYDDGTIESGIANSGEAEEYRNRQSQPQQQQPQQQQPQQQAPSGLDDNAVRQLYQQYLGRDADQGGLDTWRGQSYDQVLQGILGSGEYAQRITNQQKPATPMNSGAGTNPVTQEPQSGLTDEQVKQLYNRYLGRNPDPDGMNTFRGMDMAKAITEIASSQEFKNKEDAKQAAAGATGGVNWLIDPNNLAKNAVSWSDYYGQGQYHYADGSTALADPSSPNTAISITPPYSSYENPANMRLGYRNYAYAGSSVPDTVTINGVELPVQKPEYLINGKTGKVFTDPEKGNRTYTILDVTPQNQSGELYKVFDSTIKIGAGIMISFAAPEIGAGILSSTLTGAEAAAYAASIANGMTSAQALAATGAYTAGQAAAVGAAVASTGNQAMIDAVNEKNGKAILDAAATTLGTTALSYGISTAAGSLLPTGLPSTVAGGATGAVKGSVTAILGGKDPISGLARGTISGLTSGAIKDIQAKDINDFDLQGDDQVFDTEEQRYLTPYEVSVKYPELYPEGLPVEERTFGEKLAGTTATTLAGALSSYFFPSTKPSTGSTRTSGRTISPTTGAKEVVRETTQPTARSPTSQPTPMMATSSASPATSSYFGPSTAALGQALNTGSVSLASGGSGGGGETGSTGEDISEESGQAPKKKWVNAQSLRDLDEIGS